MRLNKSEREFSNRLAILIGLGSLGLFWLGLFTGYHLYLWAVGVFWHVLLVSLVMFLLYLIFYRFSLRKQMQATKGYYARKNKRERERNSENGRSY